MKSFHVKITRKTQILRFPCPKDHNISIFQVKKTNNFFGYLFDSGKFWHDITWNDLIIDVIWRHFLSNYCQTQNPEILGSTIYQFYGYYPYFFIRVIYFFKYLPIFRHKFTCHMTSTITSYGVILCSNNISMNWVLSPPHTHTP